MSNELVKILLIEDNSELAELARAEIFDAFEDDKEMSIALDVENDFDRGYERASTGGYDLIVLDLRREDAAGDDDDAGQRTFSNIRGARFIPIVFWTALPDHVADKVKPPFVTVAKKTALDQVPLLIREAVKSHAAHAMRAIEASVSEVLRQHMWDELAPNWDEYSGTPDEASLSQVLISRLARVLEAKNNEQFTSHPHHRYVYPPAAEHRAPGDLLMRDEGEGDATWWVVLTPACDFMPRKDGIPNAERVVLAAATPVEEADKYKAWAKKIDDKSNWSILRRDILTATHSRFSYLPAFRDIPDLVVDLQHLASEPISRIAEYRAVASLAGPFAEALLAQHSHYAGRIGIPDLNVDLIRQRFEASIEAELLAASAVDTLQPAEADDR